MERDYLISSLKPGGSLILSGLLRHQAKAIRELYSSDITFVKELEKVYGTSHKFSQLEQGKKNVVIIFVTGFKPKGDDSRPDRGLMPLGRMLAGPDELVITFLWGPAKKAMLEKLKAKNINLEDINLKSKQQLRNSLMASLNRLNSNPFTAKLNQNQIKAATLDLMKVNKLSTEQLKQNLIGPARQSIFGSPMHRANLGRQS
jgi:arsenate reductase-like glutaredoxin family protein